MIYDNIFTVDGALRAVGKEGLVVRRVNGQEPRVWVCGPTENNSGLGNATFDSGPSRPRGCVHGEMILSPSFKYRRSCIWLMNIWYIFMSCILFFG